METKVPTVGIIGGGFVGSSLALGFEHYTEVKIFDINPDVCTHEYEEVIEQDVLFLCLPTPMTTTGSVDTTLVERELDKLRGMLPEYTTKPVILKSTIPPEVLGRLMLEYPEFVLIFCPEFLTERTATLDFQQSNRLIFGSIWPENDEGGDEYDEAITKTQRLFEIRFPRVPQFWMSPAEASLIKYGTNVFFCIKLAFFNEFAQVCRKYDLEPNSVISKILLDQRIGRSHHMVPGHDGKPGFGGSCFPKDCCGYIHIAEAVEVEPTVANAAWAKNIEVRPERDWEELKGRAVSDESRTMEAGKEI